MKKKGWLLLILILIFIAYIAYSRLPKNNNQSKPQSNILILNTDKNTYSLKERVEIKISSLDSNGKSLCQSNLELKINNSSFGEKVFKLNNGISKSPTCSNNQTNDADYNSNFTATQTGDYLLTLKNLDNNEVITKTIKVSSSEPNLTLTRSGATRINPSSSNRYPMVITVTANSDFSGQIKEIIPNDINLVWQGPAKVETKDNKKVLTWEVSLKKGESKNLSYEYNLSKLDSTVYNLGPITINNSEEQNFWQVIVNKE